MTHLRIPAPLLSRVRADLRRRHAIAWERVGFLVCRGDGGLLVATSYVPLEDSEYEESAGVGAQYSNAAITRMLRLARAEQASLFNVHDHGETGMPAFSAVDLHSLKGLVPGFFAMHPGPHGALVLSGDAVAGVEWRSAVSGFQPLDRITEVGAPLHIWEQRPPPNTQADPRDGRQGFLGPHARERLGAARVGLVGYSGGGSHVGQQLAHVMVPRLTVFEPQDVEDSNLNRLVGATHDDVGQPKVGVARRVLAGLMPMDEVHILPARWQEHAEALRACDVIVGCVDSAHERDEIERECRKWVIPYVDIGLGITLPAIDGEDPLVAGQMAVSLPGEHCLRCFRIITEAELAREADDYGDRAPAPQVVWSNAVLASIAVGVVVELITGWRRKALPHRILRLRGDGTVGPPEEYRSAPLPARCTHYQMEDAGPAVVRRG